MKTISDNHEQAIELLKELNKCYVWEVDDDGIPLKNILGILKLWERVLLCIAEYSQLNNPANKK